MKTEIELHEDQETSLATQGGAIVAEATTFAVIRDDDHGILATEFAGKVKRLRSMVDALFGAPIEQAHKLHKLLCGRRNALDNPLESAEKAVKKSIGAYEDQKRRAIEAQRQIELQEARRVAEAAERERQKQIEWQRKAEEDRRLADAQALADRGKHDAAEAVLNAPIHVPPPPPVVAPPIATAAYKAPAGTSVRYNWKHRIIDADAIPREWLIPDEKRIGEYVRAMKDKSSIPGVEAYSEASASMR